jgi:D-alanyl-D-alanine carboxypeptidase
MAERLAQLRGRRTRYEIVIALPSPGAFVMGARFLLAYTSSRSLCALIAALRKHWPEVKRVTGVTETTPCRPARYGTGIDYQNGVTIRFSGFTERDAIRRGELPPIVAALDPRCNNS